MSTLRSASVPRSLRTFSTLWHKRPAIGTLEFTAKNVLQARSFQSLCASLVERRWLLASTCRPTAGILSNMTRRWNSTTNTPTNTESATPPPTYYTDDQRTVMEECRKLHGSIMPLNDTIRGPLAPHSDQGTALPFVLLLGNHSSGKSSFINHVLGRKIQTTGVAPTDDAFTIIAPGPSDRDQDGPAVIGDPDLGFGPLRQFGPTLMHHVQLKIRSEVNSNFLIVDTPGMIDAPGNYPGMINNNSNDGGTSEASSMDRGYDFTGVVRWLADRADVVCLFFDPDKPGTTGETLSILLHSLSGMDHKLLIVLNKADQFSKIHDFARAYGSLCWNLSKVIPRKDLPRIYTMCLPVEYQEKGKQQQQQQERTTTSSSTINDDENSDEFLQKSKNALQDLFSARKEVVAEVRKAPERRMDNWITGLHDAISQLHMHALMLRDIQTRYSKLYWQFKWQELSLAATGGSLTALFAMYGMDLMSGTATGGMIVAAMGTTTVVSTGFMVWYHGQQLHEWQVLSSKRDELFATFQRTHGRAIQEGDEYIAALWQRIRPQLVLALETQLGGADSTLATVSSQDLEQLQQILKEDIPRLRRLASPPHYGK